MMDILTTQIAIIVLIVCVAIFIGENCIGGSSVVNIELSGLAILNDIGIGVTELQRLSRYFV